MNLQGALNFDGPIVTDPLREQSSFRPIRTRSKRVRDISRQNNNRLRDEAKKDRKEGHETKEQRVHRCVAAYANRYGQWATAAELTFYMHQRGEIPKANINLVAPRLAEMVNGKVRKVNGERVRVGGGVLVLKPLRTCRINGDDCHPYAIPEVGGAK